MQQFRMRATQLRAYGLVYYALVIGMTTQVEPSLAGGGGCTGNGCQTSVYCQFCLPRQGAAPASLSFSGNLDSLSLMRDPIEVSPTVRVSDWVYIFAEGTWGLLGDVSVTLNSEIGTSQYRMISQSNDGDPFYPADVSMEMYWRLEAEDKETGGTTVLVNDRVAIYETTGVTSFPPTPGTVFTLTSQLELTDGSGCVVCTADGPSSVVYSGRIPDRPTIINEVDADDGGDGRSEFIELFDGGFGKTPLDNGIVVLFDGSSDTSYGEVFDLNGHTTDADGYFVIGGSAVSGADLVKTVALVDGPGAVAIYYEADPAAFAPGASVTDVRLYDAIVYGTGDAPDPGLLVLLREKQQQVDESGNGNSAAHSSQRIPDGEGWRRDMRNYEQHFPTPGEANAVEKCGNDVREGNEKCDGTADVACPEHCLPDCTCEPETKIPTLSEWGLIVLTAALLTAGAVVFGRRRRSAAG